MESNYFPKAEMSTVQEITNYPLRNRGELDWYKKKLKDLRDLESSVKGVEKKSESKDSSLYKMNVFKNVPPKYLDTDDWIVKRKKYIKNRLNDESIYVRNILPKNCQYMLPRYLNKSAAIRNLPKIMEYKKNTGNLPKNISTNVLDNKCSKTIPHNELKKCYSTVKDDNHNIPENNTLFNNNNNNMNNTIPNNNNDNNTNNESNENVENNNNENASNNNVENVENNNNNVENKPDNIANNNNNDENTYNNNNNENNFGNIDNNNENEKILLNKLEKELNSIEVQPTNFYRTRKKLTEIDYLIDEYRRKYGYNNELDLLLAEYDIVKEKRKEKEEEVELEERITKENELKEKIRLEKERIAKEQELKKNKRYENLVAEENKDGLNQNVYSDNNLDNYEPYNDYNDYKKISIPLPEEKPLILPRITKNFIKTNIKLISEIQKPRNLSKKLDLQKKKKIEKIPEYIIQYNIEREIALREKMKKEEEVKSKREQLLTDAERVQILNSLVKEKEELEKTLDRMNVIDRSVTIQKIKANLDVRLDQIDREIDELAKKTLTK